MTMKMSCTANCFSRLLQPFHSSGFCPGQSG